MTFLNPVAGIIGASIAVPALLLLYFLKLRRRPLRVSSTLLWERAVHDLQVNVPFRWLRFSWLLLLQLLALAALLGALARPAINMQQAASRRTVVLIDRSASMQAADGGFDAGGAPRSRLEQSRQAARRFVESVLASGGGEAMVVVFAARPQTLTPLTASLDDLLAAIDSITPTDQPADLGAALKSLEPLAVSPADESTDPALMPSI